MRTLFLASALPFIVLAVACGDAEDPAPFGAGGAGGAGTAGKGGSSGASATGGKAGGTTGGSAGAGAGRGGTGGAAGSGGSPAAGRGGSGTGGSAGGSAGEAGSGAASDGGTNATGGTGGGAGASGEGGTSGIVGAAPVATINHPGDGETRMTGDMIPFVGVGTDAEDGALSGGSLVWTSDIEGPIGTGAMFDRALSQAGTQVITLTVTDSDGNTGTDSIALEME
jgi:hypothetical protein